LTADEGARVLEGVRDGRTRVSELTPAEKRYLQQTLRK
jgi:hypothetical protein